MANGDPLAGQGRPGRAAALFALALVAADWTYLLWLAPRGFDFTDEGYYLLASRHPEDVLAWANAGHVYTALLFRALGGDVVRFRLAGLVLLALGAHVLAVGLSRQLERLGLAGGGGRAERLLVWAFVQLGALLYCHLRLLTPSFNLLNAVALDAAAGWLCLGLARIDADGRTARGGALALGAAGASLGLSFFCKFSSGIAALALSTLAVLVWPGMPPAARRRTVACLLAGALSWAVLHFALLQGPAAWWAMIVAGIAWLRAAVPWVGPGAVFEYAATLAHVAGAALRAFGPAVVAAPLAVAIARGDSPGRARRAALPALLVGTAAIAYHRQYHWRGLVFGNRFLELYVGWLLVLGAALAAAALVARGTPPDRRRALLALLLGLVPLAGAVGTADVVSVVVLWYLAPLFGCLVVLLATLATAARSRLVLPLGVALIAPFAAAQVLSRATARLWHHPTGTFQQTVATEVGVPPSRLLLSRQDAALVAHVRKAAAACGFRPGADVVAFYNLPGLVFAIGGRSPGVPWLLWRSSRGKRPRATREAAALALAAAPPERVRGAFVLTDARATARVPDLTRWGRRFPDDYEACGGPPIPMGGRRLGLWRPRRSAR